MPWMRSRCHVKRCLPSVTSPPPPPRTDANNQSNRYFSSTFNVPPHTDFGQSLISWNQNQLKNDEGPHVNNNNNLPSVSMIHILSSVPKWNRSSLEMHTMISWKISMYLQMIHTPTIGINQSMSMHTTDDTTKRMPKLYSLYSCVVCTYCLAYDAARLVSGRPHNYCVLSFVL